MHGGRPTVNTAGGGAGVSHREGEGGREGGR